MSKTKKKLTKREASALGTIAARPVIEKLKHDRMTAYYANPFKCKNCGKVITYEQKLQGSTEFCSRSCAASFNNRNKPPKSLEVRQKISDSLRTRYGIAPRKLVRKCKMCGVPIPRSNEEFCSNECFRAYEWNKKKLEIDKTGTMPTTHCGETDTRNAKRYLAETIGLKCCRCGVSELQGVPVPLQIHHIDGDAMNSRVENLQLLCPTCHAMTDNYSCKHNHRSTRKSRRKYWTSKEDRRDLSMYRSEIALEDKPASEFPIKDIRDDMISMSEYVRLRATGVNV